MTGRELHHKLELKRFDVKGFTVVAKDKDAVKRCAVLDVLLDESAEQIVVWFDSSQEVPVKVREDAPSDDLKGA